MSNRHLKVSSWASAALFLSLLGMFFSAPTKMARAIGKDSPRSTALPNPKTLVDEMVQNELKAEKDDSTHWLFRKTVVKPGDSKTWEVVETKQGEVQRLVTVDGHPLNPQQQQAEQQRLQQFLRNRDEQKKKRETASSDFQKEQALMKMLPNALLYSYDGKQDDLIRLTFKPNPDFKPTTREAEVFHHMAGVLVINRSNMRLAEFRGRIISRVNFGYGLLGHLDKGGAFDVKQQDVGSGHWDLTLLFTHITGKALFFKTISVSEKIVESNYHRVPNNLTLEQAANMLKSASRSASQIKTPSRQSAEVAAAPHHH
ncbi:MAG TPA: hypothetical protein VKS20_00805 [Candidatus Acidoferrales bacterium]|nr:hypothetical protein [Candidatus Acidoferrales bacterium]